MFDIQNNYPFLLSYCIGSIRNSRVSLNFNTSVSKQAKLSVSSIVSSRLQIPDNCDSVLHEVKVRPVVVDKSKSLTESSSLSEIASSSLSILSPSLSSSSS